jgi:alpha-amylase
MKFLLITTFLILTTLLSPAFARTAEEWKTRSVYQIITDRFAKTDGDTTPCTDLGNYCGGTFKGIQNNLDYIQDMGFDAIWISPIVSNTEGGYHGYWTKNLYEINEHFGTEQDLHELIQACHERDMWIMVDVVANHMGYFRDWNYSSLYPFNDASHYNPYHDCDLEMMKTDQDHTETCWLSGLPDLNQSHPFVKGKLLEWARDFSLKYKIDALRIDTVPHVPKTFWAEFSRAAGVYTVGEILNFDLKYLAGYQGVVDGVLNYALYSALRYAFQAGGSMNVIEEYYNDAYSTWADISVLGNFVNNHDNPRFLAGSDNMQAFKSALAFSMTSVGIPMVYYGDEQGYKGGQDPQNREALWANMDRETDISTFIKKINYLRKGTQYYMYEQIQRYSDPNFYAFSRGELFFAFTNTNEQQTRTITYHPYEDGTILCNIFYENDCVKVEDGAFPVTLLNGEVKIFTSKKGESSDPSVEPAESIGELIDLYLKTSLSSFSMIGSA